MGEVILESWCPLLGDGGLKNVLSHTGIYMSAKGVMAITRKVEHPLHLIW